MSVTRHPPHRSRRAELPHRAPQECAQVELRSCLDSCWTISYGLRLVLSSGSRPWLLDHAWLRHLPALPRCVEGRNGEAFALTAPVEPFVNQPPRPVGETSDLLRVADHAIVVPMPSQLTLEGGEEFAKRHAPRLLQPVLELAQACTELLGVGAAFHDPVVRIASAFHPVEVEAEEGEPSATFRLPPVEFDQRALLFS